MIFIQAERSERGLKLGLRGPDPVVCPIELPYFFIDPTPHPEGVQAENRLKHSIEA